MVKLANFDIRFQRGGIPDHAGDVGSLVDSAEAMSSRCDGGVV